MLCNYHFNIKISSLGLMFKHKQFDSNYLTKHIFSQKYILVSLFLGFTFQYSNKSSVHLVNRISRAFPAQFQSKHDLTHNCIILNPNQPWSSHGLLYFFSKFYNNSIPRFGIDPTAPNGLNRLKHSKSTKNGNKTQVGRKSYLLEFEETP